MIDALIVLRKEMLELVADRHSFRGALGQSAIMLCFLGVYLPSTDTSFWNDPTAMLTLFFIFPSLLAATIAADAFAGERERRTLETLLATPLSDESIFFGKAGWAVLYSFIIAMAALACGLITTRLSHGPLRQFVPWEAVPAAAGGALGAAVLTAAAAVLVSSKLPVARSAEQATRVVTLVIGAILAGLAHLLLIGFGWSTLCGCELVLLVIGASTVRVGALFFRRDRIFEKP